MSEHLRLTFTKQGAGVSLFFFLFFFFGGGGGGGPFCPGAGLLKQ